MKEPVRVSFDAADLMATYPPRIPARQKRALYELVCPPDVVHAGTIDVARYAVETVDGPYDPDAPVELELVLDHFSYDDSDIDAWYLNFADRDLFCAYGSNLFAQDEIQVAEHPALGALREAMLAKDDLPPLASDETGPTPVLIRGVERRAAIDTRDIYGWRFARATDLEHAVARLDPPTRSNILCLEAPSGGRGLYTSMQITNVLETAYTGFSAAKKESGGPVEIHTGFWGCGAFGGNRVLLPMLQIAAAKIAGVDRLVFHAREDADDFQKAKAALDEITEAPLSVSALVSAVTARGFRWGVPDGN